MTDKLDPNTKINVEEILEDLENYHPPRKGWTWRTVPEGGVDMAGFHFRNMSEPLKNSVPMPTAKYFDDPFVRQVRVSQFNPETLRIVFDLKQAVAPQVFTLKPAAGY